jgi:hypothetical protein
MKIRSKSSIQQKWDHLIMAYKDTVDENKTGSAPHTFEFFNEMADTLKDDPSVEPPIIHDSISGIKRKVPRAFGNDIHIEQTEKKPKKEQRATVSELKNLIQENTIQVIEYMKEQDKKWEESEKRRELAEESRHSDWMKMFGELLKF